MRDNAYNLCLREAAGFLSLSTYEPNHFSDYFESYNSCPKGTGGNVNLDNSTDSSASTVHDAEVLEVIRKLKP